MIRCVVWRSAVSIALLLAAAAGVNAQAVAPDSPRPNGHSSGQITEKAKMFLEMASTPEKVQSYISNYTRMTHDDAHGTQIEYNAPDGRSYLWYPGSRRVTPGHWRVAEGLAPDQIHHYVGSLLPLFRHKLRPH